MNNETKTALRCAAKLRQVLTDVVEQLERADISLRSSPEGREISSMSAIDSIKTMLKTEGLYERIYPLDPQEGEPFATACRRIFGPWVTHDVLGMKGGGG